MVRDPFLNFFTHRVGQEISLCAATFCRGVIHPSADAYTLAYSVQVYPIDFYPFIFMSTCFYMHYSVAVQMTSELEVQSGEHKDEPTARLAGYT